MTLQECVCLRVAKGVSPPGDVLGELGGIRRVEFDSKGKVPGRV